MLMKLSSYNTFMKMLMTEGLESACESASRLGFGGVELLDACPLNRKATYEKYTVDEYLRAFEKYNLRPACYSTAACLWSDDEEATLGELFRQADFAAAIGTKLFHHTFTIGLPHTPDTLPYQEVLARVVPVAQKVAEHCDRLGMTCLYEPQGFYVNGIDGLETLYEEMARRVQNIGICGDMGNPLFAEAEPEKLFAHFAPYIKHVHVKDYIRTETPLPDIKGSRSRGGKYLYDCRLGDGIVNIGACIKSLVQVGYDGYISFEISGDENTVTDAIQHVRNKIKTSLA